MHLIQILTPSIDELNFVVNITTEGTVQFIERKLKKEFDLFQVSLSQLSDWEASELKSDKVTIDHVYTILKPYAKN